MIDFSKTLLNWYSENKRDLPWRGTLDPYRIWLSEVILQQTRISQGLPYYEKFISRYPVVSDMARADETDILKLWQGLGYYSRARNMHAAARTVEEKYNGKFPSSYSELIKLKGVGDYTASAVASICAGEPTPVVDGNVYRVLARFFGVDLPTNSPEGSKYFKKLAGEVMDPQQIGDYNQAVMEFGALQCKPRNPDCETCPLNKSCFALQEGKVQDLPVKVKKKGVRIRYFNYLFYLDRNGSTLLKKRKGKGIWQHLYEFPLIETDRLMDPGEAYGAIRRHQNREGEVRLWKEEPVVHKLSHQHLVTRFWVVETKEELAGGIPLKKIEEYPVPVLVADFLRTFKNSYF